MQTRLQTLALALGLIALIVLSRVLPHEPNLTATGAAALFAGFLFRSRLLALAVPMVAMGLSDLIIGGYNPATMLVVYASLAVPVLMRPLVRGGQGAERVARIAGCALAGSIVFFVTTNAAVWAFDGIYTRTLTGLVECFAAALPFFRFTVIGDFAFATLLFGGHALAMRAAVAGRCTSDHAACGA